MFETQYESWLSSHESGRSGERLRRLRVGHRHAEKLFCENAWWPAIGSFEFLHPEYEVYDFKDGVRYLGFAYIRPPLKVCFEVDGYGPHHRDIDRRQFADQLTRQNHLVLDGWIVLRYSYDDLKEKPRQCQQMIHQLMGRYFGKSPNKSRLPLKQQKILRIAMSSADPLSPVDIAREMNIGIRQAREALHALTDNGLMMPVSGEKRIRSYRLAAPGSADIPQSRLRPGK